MYRITRLPDKLDLHMHTVVSDGTDAPECRLEDRDGED